MDKQHFSLIRKYKKFYASLDSGERKPQTPAQEHFVKVCRGYQFPVTEHEHAWLAYKKAQKEADERRRMTGSPSDWGKSMSRPSTANDKQRVEELWGSRDDWKRDRAHWKRGGR